MFNGNESLLIHTLLLLILNCCNVGLSTLYEWNFGGHRFGQFRQNATNIQQFAFVIFAALSRLGGQARGLHKEALKYSDRELLLYIST